jgi:hypothetical protein
VKYPEGVNREELQSTANTPGRVRGCESTSHTESHRPSYGPRLPGVGCGSAASSEVAADRDGGQDGSL